MHVREVAFATNAVFQLTISFCFPDIFANKSLSCANQCLGLPNFGRGVPQISDPIL